MPTLRIQPRNRAVLIGRRTPLIRKACRTFLYKLAIIAVAGCCKTGRAMSLLTLGTLPSPKSMFVTVG